MNRRKPQTAREFKERFRQYKKFDTVSGLNIEIKCTENPGTMHYDLGTVIPLDDGLYIGNEGWFVAYNDKVLISGKKIYDKWGCERVCNDMIQNKNPISVIKLDIEDILDDEELERLV